MKKLFSYIFAVLIGTLFLTGCLGLQSQEDKNKNINVNAPEDKPSCESSGGQWGLAGTAAGDICNLPTSDGGEECLDSDQCEGYCLADNLTDKQWENAIVGKVRAQGHCSNWRVVSGCQAFVEDGYVEGANCVD